MAAQGQINWPLHIVLVLLTGGLWLIPLLFIILKQGNR
jgi:hypothetical protein